ncbi:MAG TPA: insulinase family protein [Phycisphaerae bacterium]|nr:insulinase family protein [Phycisphaerae bacterium]
MLHTLRLTIVGLVSLTVLAAPAAAQPLPTDPSLVTGELDNGLRYIVRKHANPPGRAAMWIHIASGSLNETDRQRGLAHYLEHMAFNGSEHFPPGSLVPFFQSLGMTFGRDQNAFTSFEQTTYQLSLPDVKPETLEKGMTYFADVLHRLLLRPEEIDAERGIILEEWRRGLSGRQRTMYYVMEHIAPGSLYGLRIPIGTEETITNLNEADFRDYYGRWYIPANATLIVVADTEPEAVIGVIRSRFGDAPKRPRPAPQALNVTKYERSFAIVASDDEVRSEDIRIVRLEPARPPVTTVPQYRHDLVMRLGEMAMNRRLSDKVARGGTSYLNARVGTGNESNAIYTAEMSASAAPGKWRPALEEIALELQRGRAFGFMARELDDAKTQIMTGAERAVETEETQLAATLLRRINGDVTSGEPTMSPQQRLDLLRQLLPTISLEEASKRFADEFDTRAVAFVAVLPAGDNVPTEAELLEIGTRALAVQPEPDVETARATQLMDALPTPGTVVEGEEHTTSRVWSGWLSNNVRVHYRFMDERKNEAAVSIALIGGELLETAANRGVTQAAQLAWSQPATRKLASTDIRDLMTGKKVSVGGGFGGGGRGGRRGGGGGGGDDSITLSISGSPADLETGFQLVHLLLTEPKVEAPAFERYQTRQREMLQEALKNPMMLGMRTAGAAPYPDDEPRTQPLTVENVDRLTVEAAQAWLERLLKESPIEVVIVGDVPRERVLELTARYLGSLPARPRVSSTTYAALRRLKRPAGPRVVERSMVSSTPQAFVLSGFYGADETNVADTRALNMAARILSTRMIKEVREDAQLVYSIGAGSRPGSTYPGFGVFSAAAPTDPGKVTTLTEKLASMYEAFVAQGPTDEEMDVAKKQFANSFEQELREPAFWARRMGGLTFRGASLDDVVNDPAAYQALTAQQVKETFAKYYSKANSIVVSVKPEPDAEPAATDKPATAGKPAPAEKPVSAGKSTPTSKPTPVTP